MKPTYRRTLLACYVGYISQAIIVNLLPLFFVMLQDEFSLSVTQIGFMVTYNFAIQLLTDLVAAKYADKVGYRACLIFAQITCSLGLVGLSLFPAILPNAYTGLLAAITIYAVGGGLIEVLVGPVVQALPLDQTAGAVSILHSFYCWGHAGVVLLTTLLFRLLGTHQWRLIALLWAIIPTANIFLFATCPLYPIVAEGEAIPFRKLFSSKMFWIFALLMMCAAGTEHSMGQWSSYFAETGLQVPKAVGDLLGPCVFALLMGLTRALYGAYGNRFPLEKALVISGILSIVSYLTAVFSPIPLISLIGCGFSGVSAGLLWPGVFNLSAEYHPQGGTAMFALLALFGDMGCSLGPSLVSSVADRFGGELKAGLLAALIFPITLAFGVNALRKTKKSVVKE